ncbi:MAG: hypothetical protein Q4D06_02065 [Coriobacteriia bacterium]|nr:hypothetical protein [Coriobacteriia bacterium]
MMPLYYAIIKHFQTVDRDCADGVIAALEPQYGSYKLLNPKDVDEALATARENGLLEEVHCDLGTQGQLRIHYAMTEFGADMTERYIGRYHN